MTLIEGLRRLLQSRLQSQTGPQQPPSGQRAGNIAPEVQRTRQFVFGPECNRLGFATVQEWEGSQSTLSRANLVFEIPCGIENAAFVAACKECDGVFTRLEGAK